MNLTPEQRAAKQDRNDRIRKDFANGVSKKELGKKYNLCHDSIYAICRATIKDVNREEPELTEFQKRMIEKYKNFDLNNEYGKALAIRSWDVQTTVQPKRYSDHYSQVIFR